MKHSRGWLRWITRLAVVASFGLIGWFLWRHAAELRSVDWYALTWPTLLNLLLYGIALALQCVAWIAMWSWLSNLTWHWEDVRAYYATHLMRRIPGAPWYIAGRTLMYGERGPDAAKAALAVSLIEWAGFILTGLIWVAGGQWGLPGVGVALVLLALTVPLLRSWSWPRRWVPLQRFSSGRLYLSLLAYSIQWCIAALMLHIYLRALVPSVALGFWQTGVIWAGCGVISTLAVFAPAGLGIRELSLVALLQPHMGLGYAALSALLMRVIFTLGDLVWGLLVGLSTIRTLRANTP